MKIFLSILTTLLISTSASSFAGNDAGAAFMPDSGEKVSFKGKLDGNNLTCGKSKRSQRKCQRKFESVYNKANFSGTFRGYVEEKGKRRRNMRFGVGTVEIDGRDVRVIYQVDFRDGDTDIGLDGIFWLEPMSNTALRD